MRVFGTLLICVRKYDFQFLTEYVIVGAESEVLGTTVIFSGDEEISTSAESENKYMQLDCNYLQQNWESLKNH